MHPIEKIQEYSKAVCHQIRWKRAHGVIGEEIENHLIDQRDAYMADGADEAAATDKAILQMGDPVDIGMQLDRTHRPKPQRSMILMAAAILCVGILIRLFIINDLDRPWLLPMQLLSTAMGAGLMAAAYYSDFTLLGKYPKMTCFSIIGLSIAVLILSPMLNGKSFYGGFMPLLFPLGFAASVYAARNKGYWGMALCEVSFLVFGCIAILVPTASGLLLFALSGIVLLGMAASRNWFNVKKLHGYLLLLVTVMLTLASVFTGYGGGLARLQIALDPSIDPMGSGFVGTVTRALLQGSKLLGRGAVSENYAMLTFPEPNIHTDYLLTYLIFNVGWIAFIIIMAILLLFIVKGFMLCFKQRSALGLFVSVSVMLTFTMQVFSYVMANLGFQFAAPISLPLISYGNVATVINLTLIGIMLSVFRTGGIVKDNSLNMHRGGGRIAWDDGKLIISFGKK